MEAQIYKNYADEIIPYPAELLKEVEQLTKKIIKVTKYSFPELFTEIGNKERTEYHRNNSIWHEEIGYNTWDKNAIEELEKDENERRKMNEVKGLYIFYEDNIPIYVGISRLILKRLKHHFLGKIHNEATLVYLMIRHKHDEIYGLYDGERAYLPNFNKERGDLQEKMRKNWSIAIIPETDNYRMYFFEAYLACYLKTKWNSFETH